MIWRILFLLVALAVLGVLLYMQQGGGGPATSSTGAAQNSTGLPGFVAVGAQIIETGDNGQPLYRLDAQRIEQPVPGGTVFLTEPVIHYQPPGGSAWVLTAQQGQLPQNAHTAELIGAVHAQGQPQGSTTLLKFNTDSLHVDMQQQIATTAAEVHIDYGRSLLAGRGMRANLKSGELELFKDVTGALHR